MVFFEKRKSFSCVTFPNYIPSLNNTNGSNSIRCLSCSIGLKLKDMLEVPVFKQQYAINMTDICLTIDIQGTESSVLYIKYIMNFYYRY